MKREMTTNLGKLLAVALILPVLGCYTGGPTAATTDWGGGGKGGAPSQGGKAGAFSAGKGGASTGGAPSTGGSPPTNNELPCELAQMLAQNCQICHGHPPLGSDVSLVTYADLVLKSEANAELTNAELALTRMQDTVEPMPPGKAPDAANIQILKDWIQQGMPKGSCGARGVVNQGSGLNPGHPAAKDR